jgi:membrane-associated protease RseP (regulator of RpoE activity)
MTGGNGERPPLTLPGHAELLAPPPETFRVARPRRRVLLLAVALFLLTLLSTLAAGAEFQLAFLEERAPFSEGFSFYADLWLEPRMLLLGVPFSLTLMGILLAHELGHYFACRYYGIAASYPYFIPAPTIIGTMGAFIRIRSPIVNRKALFDVGLAGPIVGFLFAVPALYFGLAASKLVGPGQIQPVILFGQPLLVRGMTELLHPELQVRSAAILLHPVARAAWVGLFATALNLIPIGQLDGGHVLYALASEKHRRVSLTFVLVLGLLGLLYWEGWLFWAGLLLLLGFRHPALLDRWEPIDTKRRAWAVVAVIVFVLCFMQTPLSEPGARFPVFMRWLGR